MDRWIRVLVTTAVVLVAFGMEVRAADVPYISGGTGADERAELLAKEKEYNLKIIGAAKSGDYLAGVKVVIESARRNGCSTLRWTDRFSWPSWRRGRTPSGPHPGVRRSLRP